MRVLQMVHMLLAFELFVVVVVDARWVEDALTQSYRWLADGATDASDDPNDDGDARPQLSTAVTPQDYLEKIFQIGSSRVVPGAICASAGARFGLRPGFRGCGRTVQHRRVGVARDRQD